MTQDVHIMVKAHVADGGVGKCAFCVASKDLNMCRDLQKLAPSSEYHYCTNVMWIHNTDEAKAEHTIRLLEAV